MVVVDTSVWIDHFRKGNAQLDDLLAQDQVLMHEAVLGELACGTLPNRKQTLRSLGELPRAESPPAREVLLLIEQARLFGQGMGWTDVQLIGAALLAKSQLFTLDRALMKAARRLRIHY